MQLFTNNARGVEDLKKSHAQEDKRNQIRYNLHRIIRKEGYKLITRKRTIYVHFKNLDFTKSVLRLRDEFGYSIQTELE